LGIDCSTVFIGYLGFYLIRLSYITVYIFYL